MHVLVRVHVLILVHAYAELKCKALPTGMRSMAHFDSSSLGLTRLSLTHAPTHALHSGSHDSLSGERGHVPRCCLADAEAGDL